VLVEYEGDGHRTSRGKFRSDITRVEEYADGGWFALRAQADDVFADPNPFLGRLGRRLERRGWRNPRELRQVVGARR
jgi:very-short-patch-repair endonuclease